MGHEWLYLGLGSIIAAIGAFWSQARSFWNTLSGHLILRSTVFGYQADALQAWCGKNLTVSRFGDKLYVGWKFPRKPSGTELHVSESSLSSQHPRLCWYGWWPVWVSSAPIEKLFGAASSAISGLTTSDYRNDAGMQISFLRGMIPPDRMQQEAADLFNQMHILAEDTGRQSRFQVIHLSGSYGEPAMGQRTGGDPGGTQSRPRVSTDQGTATLGHRFLDGYVPHAEQQEPPTDDLSRLWLNPAAAAFWAYLQEWILADAWYVLRGVPWRTGANFHGDPGTGKTAFTRSAAKALGIPVISIDLATCTNADLHQHWRTVYGNSPCIALLEDIDNIFHGRENVSGSPLTFDCLLNCIDGVEQVDGVCVIITTNKLEHIDEALGQLDEQGRPTRPGRIDYVVEMTRPDAAGRHQIATRILQGLSEAVIADVVREGAGDTGAQFQQRCNLLAMTFFRDSNRELSVVDAALSSSLVKLSTAG